MRVPKKLLIFSQTFVPDPASVGQHIADAALEMARRGHPVRVYTSARGYEDPSVRYPARENMGGVDVIRLPWASFGKKSLFTRILGTASFMIQCLLRGLLTPNLGGILFSTSPPMVGIVASVVGLVRRVPTAYWAMDLNPDQLIALGKLRPDALSARLLEAANRFFLRHAALVISLDRFMAQRLAARVNLDGRLLVAPPWPHEEHVDPIAHAQNPFRAKHGLADKFVVMYSGNHTPSNPLTTILQAAQRLRDDPSIRFLFVGGGLGKKEVESFAAEHALPNVASLPYQPLTDLRYSLSAADVHLVSLGAEMAGIIHPCKVYGAMAVGRPVLFVGPRPSHISDLLDANDFGVQVAHGDVEGAIAAIRRLRDLGASARRQMGERAQRVLQQTLSQSILCKQFCDRLETALKLSPPQAANAASQLLARTEHDAHSPLARSTQA